ncbi:pentapeptide repeat-containing protein [Fontisphaera persica]|uniref:pentapeptide repeat-containing protein n=1 Tax=Fontisphaera persica TaxID=2974023 RepID=UPI003CCCE2EE
MGKYLLPAHLRRAHLRRAHLRRAHLRRAHLRRAYWQPLEKPTNHPCTVVGLLRVISKRRLAMSSIFLLGV